MPAGFEQIAALPVRRTPADRGLTRDILRGPRGSLWQVESGETVHDHYRVNIIEVHEKDDRKPLIHELCEVGTESSHRPAVMHNAVTVQRRQLPSKPIRVGGSVIEACRLPHSAANRIAENLGAMKRRVPPGQVQNS